MYLGDFLAGATVRFTWDSVALSGGSITRGTNGTIHVYRDLASGTEVTAGVTDTEDFDSLTGIHACSIDLTADALYAAGHDYVVVLKASTIDGQTVNATLAHFSIENRSHNAILAAIAGYLDTEIADIRNRLPAALVGGRMDASVGAMAANVMSAAAAAADLTTELQSGLATSTNVSDAQTAILAKLPAALVGGRIDASVGAMAAGVLTDSAIAANAITDAKVAADVTIASVTGAVGSVAGDVGGNVAGSIGSLATQAKADVSAEVLAVVDPRTDAIEADTQDLQNRVPAALVGGRMDASVGAMAANVMTAAAAAADLTTELQNGLASAASIAATEAAILAKLPASLIAGRIDASIGAAAADVFNAAALATDAVQEIRDAIFARAFSAAYGSLTFDELQKLFAAVLLGKASGLAGVTATYRNLADNADAVVATVDADGNRTAVAMTP